MNLTTHRLLPADSGLTRSAGTARRLAIKTVTWADDLSAPAVPVDPAGLQAALEVLRAE
jgi:hypothetical protein